MHQAAARSRSAAAAGVRTARVLASNCSVSCSLKRERRSAVTAARIGDRAGLEASRAGRIQLQENEAAGGARVAVGLAAGGERGGIAGRRSGIGPRDRVEIVRPAYVGAGGGGEQDRAENGETHQVFPPWFVTCWTAGRGKVIVRAG